MTTITHPFNGIAKKEPTRKHRPALWECLFGTLYASDGREVRYFDYDWDAAITFSGMNEPDADPRLAKATRALVAPGPVGSTEGPRKGQMVLWVRRKGEGA